MRIFVADEHPLIVFADTCRHARQIPPCAGFHDIAYGREKGGAVSARKWLPFYRFLESSGPSRSTDKSLRHHFRWRRYVSCVRLPTRRWPQSYAT
jgi:hypothetical protein